jgi:N-acylglucosamine-6-phosphate 2-epimerase
MKQTVLKEGSLIVSCQALADEPLHGSHIMAKMAIAAQVGGAKGIRANSGEDIKAIKDVVDLPVIGIVKQDYTNSPVYITPTMKEVDEVVASGAEIVAIDATCRPRPDGRSLETFIKDIRTTYPNVFIMADISTYEEGLRSMELGVDIISTTLSGYTEETKDVVIPNFSLLSKLVTTTDIPIICEGGIQTPDQFKEALELGAYACVVGSAITRPQLITKKFTDVIDRATSK